MGVGQIGVLTATGEALFVSNSVRNTDVRAFTDVRAIKVTRTVIERMIVAEQREHAGATICFAAEPASKLQLGLMRRSRLEHRACEGF